MVHAGPARPRKWRGTDLFRSKSVDLEWIWVLPLGAGRLERPNGHLEQQRPCASICGYAEARITSRTQWRHKSLRELVHERAQQR